LEDQLRREQLKWRYLYGLAAWKKGLKIWKLNRNPLCEAHEKDGSCCRERATVVHHIKDHHGDRNLFFDRENLMSLCKRHHDAETMRRINDLRASIRNTVCKS
jgi:5-methylcytosine-specific restriction protein A